MPVCNGKSKRSGLPCKSGAMAGKTKCYKHGGATPCGIASPHFRHGRYSKYIPARLQDSYNEFLSDPDNLNMTASAAVLSARKDDLLQRVDSGESGECWKALKSLWTEFAKLETKIAGASGDTYNDLKIERGQMLEQLGIAINAGYEDYRAWDEVLKVQDQLRKTVDSRTKHIKDMSQMLSTEGSQVLLHNIALICRERIKDPDMLRLVVTDIVALKNKQ